ncbi:LCP family protein [Jeotgalibacillus sp. JSM ZJ347]|uniref:LCP family glycopolymer transferase n=1 Tax=Jeotgalibacillus sp. JSM ZJ347 TaxID=3342117 RepID=UPI0035A8FA4E
MKKNKKRYIWFNLLSFLLVLIILSGGIYLHNIYRSFASATQQMHAGVTWEKSDKRASELRFEKEEPFSVLLLGVDEREDDGGRSDTMIVVTVNPETETTKLLSIPRDTYVEIAGRDTMDKINHAYAFGGVDMTIKTVENYLDIPIDYFIQINMDGFMDIVNAISGISVVNEFAFKTGGFYFPAGMIDLTGEEALAYARMRYEDPDGDFGRQQRQRQVIEAVLRKAVSFHSLLSVNEFFEAVGSNIKTNLKVDEIIDIQSKYRPALNNFNEESLAGGNELYINDIYYYDVPEPVLTSVKAQLHKELELE